MRGEILVALLLISLMFLGVYTGLLMKPKETKGGISVTLVVRQYRNGNLIKEVVDRKDPFTNNFVQILYATMYNRGDQKTYTMKDISGTSRSLYISYSGTYNPLFATGNYIYIGDGTASFSINDYKLSGTNILKATSSTPSESTANPKINYTISASFSLSSAMTISEIGYSRILRDSGGSYYEFLLMRDVLSTPISALAGDTVTVTYIIRING